MRPSDAYMRKWTDHHWFRQWLIAWPAPRHYLNQCWNIVNWTLRNKLQWNLNRNSYIFIHENAFENIVCKIAAICLGLNVLTSVSNYHHYRVRELPTWHAISMIFVFHALMFFVKQISDSHLALLNRLYIQIICANVENCSLEQWTTESAFIKTAGCQWIEMCSF